MSKLHVQFVIGICVLLLDVFSGGWVCANGRGPEYIEFQRQVPVVIAQETIVSRIKVDGKKGQRLQEIVLQLQADAAAGNVGVSIYYAKSDTAFRNKAAGEWSLFARKELRPGSSAVITGDAVLDGGESYFYVACTLPPTWKLADTFMLKAGRIRVAGKNYKPETINQRTFYPAVAVRRHNQDNVHTSRIPGLARTKTGALLAIFDARYESARDLQGHMDIGLHRSEDGGQTWKPMQIAMDMGEWGGLPQKFNGVSDACILVDSTSGTIYIAATWMYGVLDDNGKWIENLQDTSTVWNHQWRKKGSQPGFDVKQSAQFMLVKSTDDGKTWSRPVNITQMGKEQEWWLWAPAPGNGITLPDGTLVFPTQGRDHTGKPFSNITYSTDGGRTWKSSAKAIDVEGGTTECAVVALPSGELMLNMRANKNRDNWGPDNGRAVSVSSDLGVTWKEHPTSFRDLPEPTCMASLFRHDIASADGSRSILFFSNPNHKSKRIHMTLKASLDGGSTWPEELQLLLDEGSSRAYSCITSVDDAYIGILYESSQADMVFQKFAVADLINKADNK